MYKQHFTVVAAGGGATLSTLYTVQLYMGLNGIKWDYMVLYIKWYYMVLYGIFQSVGSQPRDRDPSESHHQINLTANRNALSL